MYREPASTVEELLAIRAELDPEEPSIPPLEFETRRTHITQIVATKLAHIVSRTMVEKPFSPRSRRV